MGVALPPLEFTECMTDSPYFRENLHKHERELEKTNQQIKRIIKEVKDVLNSAKRTFWFFFYEKFILLYLFAQRGGSVNDYNYQSWVLYHPSSNFDVSKSSVRVGSDPIWQLFNRLVFTRVPLVINRP